MHYTLPEIRISHRASKAIQLWIKGGYKSKADALRKAGYSEAVARHPEKVFGSRAVREAMEGAGIFQQVEFLNVQQEQKELHNRGMVAVELPSLPPILSFSKDQLENLKTALADVPDLPHTSFDDIRPVQADSWKHAKETDPFEAGTANFEPPEPSSYSAM